MTRRSQFGVRAAAVRAIATVAVLLAVPQFAQAQRPRPVEPVGGGSTSRLQLALAADVVRTRATALHLGVGASVIAGRYVRLGALVAGGPRLDDDGADDGARSLDVRADAFVRFVVDPYVERRWAPYGAAGASVRRTPALRDPLAIGPVEERVRPYLLLALGVEGPPTRGWLPAAELGVGGGTRLGVVLRRARVDRR